MIKNKKYPQIVPSFLKDEKGKNIAVYLKYNEYESIFDEMKALKKHISECKKRKSTKKT
jgi:hypothetical protein